MQNFMKKQSKSYPSSEQCISIQNTETLVVVECLARLLALDSRDGVLENHASEFMEEKWPWEDVLA